MQVAITGDFLRPGADGKPHQLANVRWFYELLRVPIELATGERPELWFPEEMVQPSPEAWAQLYRNFLCPNPLVDVVVGFEMPPCFCWSLDQTNSRWINFTLHPARYMQDICFSVTASNPEALEEFTYAPGVFRVAADLVRARMSWLPDLGMGEFTLFTGQVPQDASLIKDGRFWDLPDVLDKIESGPPIFYKPHPHVAPPDALKQIVLEVLGMNLEAPPLGRWTAENFYRLICQPGCKGVISLSSSTLWEAQQFDVPATALLKMPEPGACITAGWALSPYFWQTVLGLPQTWDAQRFTAAPNVLRDTLACRWGDEALYGGVK